MPKNILIAPLNWGLGHATRCIPVIKAALINGHNVIVASDGGALELLKMEFPTLIYRELPSYEITYPKSGNFMFHMAKLVPGILKAIKKENEALDALVTELNIDVVISDNRYGMYHHDVKSIFMTHQIKVAAPFGENVLANIQKKFWKHFDEIWIPDVAESPNLSGKLGHNELVQHNAKYIGVLSRFDKEKEGEKSNKIRWDSNFILAIISGPEPQRTEFERVLLKELKQLKRPVIMVGGSPNSAVETESPYIQYFQFLGSENLQWLIQQSEVVVSRAGYSSIMDYVTLQKQAILIPTPGQTEQEYLADYLKDSGLFLSVQQSKMDLKEAIAVLHEKTVSIENILDSGNVKISEIINTI